VKALIKVDYACNNNCVFCHSAALRGRAPAVAVEEKIARAAELGCSMVVLSGGEPTIRPDLLRWGRLAAEAGLDLGLVTNGRMLAYPTLVRRLRAVGLRYVQLSLHGANARLHDGLTRAPGSFAQALRAVRALAATDVELTVNAVVTRQNLDHLDGLVDLLLPLQGARLKLSMVEPKGAALRRFDELVPPLELAAARAGAALGRGRQRFPQRGEDLVHEGFPLCLVGEELEGLARDLRSEGFALMSEVDEHDLVPVDSKNRTMPGPCEGCRLRPGCPGIYCQYLQHRPLPALRPVQ